MTNEDAIKTINIAAAEVEWDYPMDYQLAFEEAIKAINKLDKIESTLFETGDRHQLEDKIRSIIRGD